MATIETNGDKTIAIEDEEQIEDVAVDESGIEPTTTAAAAKKKKNKKKAKKPSKCW